MIAQRHAKLETIVDAVAIDLANVIVHTRCAQHGPRDAGVHSQLRLENTYALAARHQNFVRRQQRLELVDKLGQAGDHLARCVEPGRGNIHAAAAEAHVIAHHARAGERLKEVEDFFALLEGVHERRAAGAHLLNQKPNRRGMILHARQLGEDDANVLGALRNLLRGEFFHGQRVGPVVGERADVIEAVGVGHRRQIAGLLGDLLVVAVQVAEDRLEAYDALTVKRNVHAEDAVRRRVVRPHGDFEQFALAVRLNHLRPVPALGSLRFVFHDGHPAANPRSLGPSVLCSLFSRSCARLSTSSCGVGSYSKSSGST